MQPANDAHRLPDVASMRRSIQINVATLLDLKDHLAAQVEALGTVERQVRAMALLESSRLLEDQSEPAELQRLGEIQTQINFDFRNMQENYLNLAAQITGLLEQHERLYESTFAHSV